MQRICFLTTGVFFCACLCFLQGTSAQQPPPGPEVVAPASDLPPVPNGVDVMARGPVHEGYASAAGDPAPTPVIPKRPPAPIDEMPPNDRPEGDAIWIRGYWAWDDDRNDFLWVSGCWRVPPPNKEWMPGYWRDQDAGAQWVPGFWTASTAAAAPAAQQQNAPATNVTYYAAPPAPPQVAPPGAPNPDSFYVPGQWVWNDRYAWQAGYWARVQPGYVWVASHYRWTPYGHVYIPGYWDLAVPRRGILYAPVVVNPQVVGVSFVYTPTYAVSNTIVLDTLFIRPAHCHYYFGDYYAVRYQGLGFQSCVVYGAAYYDPIFAYRRWEYRGDPNWMTVQINLCSARGRGLAPLPGREVILGPAVRIGMGQGMRVVPMDARVRAEVREHAMLVQHAAVQRREAEIAHAGAPTGPRTAAFRMPPRPAAPAAHAGGPAGVNHVEPVAHPGGAPGHPAPAGHPAATARPQPHHPDPHEKKKEEHR